MLTEAMLNCIFFTVSLRLEVMDNHRFQDLQKLSLGSTLTFVTLGITCDNPSTVLPAHVSAPSTPRSTSSVSHTPNETTMKLGR